ncbi:hypothetical protein CHS0354_035018 [Potamilus streckersoni]|uniref:Carboxylesterase type B domain-containing protein n=1 Tax=Potamilus streckersoni TaxID=2493646 RepID=A0AAE0SEU3_9BIVA|nr:hypothetical protein CHS0354_035018 [Potamilus streckersoni]
MLTRQMSTRTIKTRYGNVRGALAEFSNPKLKPVEAYKGLQYGTTNDGRMRFMPPISPLEKWKYTRLAFSMRPVCPQKVTNDTDLSRVLTMSSMKRLQKIAPFTLSQMEDCLTLNIYVPIPEYILLILLT